MDVPTYTALAKVSQQQQQPLYDSPQQIMPQFEMVHISDEKPLSSQQVPACEYKEVLSSNIQHSNGAGNYSNQKERMKWLIVSILLIALTLLNVIVLITLFTKEMSCPQVSCPQVSCPQVNTTQMAQEIAQAGYVSYGNTTDEMILQQINNNITTLIDLVGDNTQLLDGHIVSSKQSQQLVNNNITTLIDMVGDNTQLLDGHIVSSKQSHQLVNSNITTLIDMVGDNTQLLNGTIKNVTVSLQQLATTHSILEDISNGNKETINGILVKIDDVLEYQNASSISSCQDMKNKHPTSPSDYYHINSQLVYCEMGELCSSEGGWTRLAYLDMNDLTVNCPPGFQLYEVNGVRACGRPDTYFGCAASIKFPSNGISYSEVCGRVVGYQYGSPDALSTSSNNIDSYHYVDGVSITQGYPRKHVWTLIAGLHSNIYSPSNCPCNTPPGASTETASFIGNDYFCESGNPNNDYIFTLYPDDPLWDGNECGSQEQDCCSVNGLPWFHKTLISTTDYLELRVCGDNNNTNEDVPISLYELYVK